MKANPNLSNIAALLVVLSVVTVSRSPLIAQDTAWGNPTTLTLAQSIRLALTNNPVVAGAGSDVDAASARGSQAGRWSNPELGFSVEEWPVSDGGNFSESKQTVGVVQELPFPGKKPLERQMGGADMRMSAGLLALRRTELIRDVRAAFHRVLAAQRARDVSTRLLTVAESSTETARKRVDAGAAAYQEQLRAEVQLEHARSALRDVERELGNARELFRMLVGIPNAWEFVLSGSLREEADSTLLAGQPDEAFAAHPSAVAAQANLDKARLAYQRAKLEPWPNLSLGVAGGRLGETDQTIVEMEVSVPLPIWKGGSAQRRETQANVRSAEAELRAVRLELRRQWNSALERYRAAVEQAERYRDGIVPKADEAMRLVQAGFEEGKFGFIDLLDTQRTAAEAQLSYQEKLLELNIAQAELEALLRPHPIESPTPTPTDK